MRKQVTITALYPKGKSYKWEGTLEGGGERVEGWEEGKVGVKAGQEVQVEQIPYGYPNYGDHPYRYRLRKEDQKAGGGEVEEAVDYLLEEALPRYGVIRSWRRLEDVVWDAMVSSPVDPEDVWWELVKRGISVPIREDEVVGLVREIDGALRRRREQGRREGKSVKGTIDKLLSEGRRTRGEKCVS